ncbi:MAG: hypothetical protein UHS49_01900 [Faecalimonas sp.]|nr:hypothetical protein [Faecalimonas sp.]
MGYYKNPEEMYSCRAKNFKRDGDRHWAQAKNGEGGYHYGKARFCYEQSEINREKAVWARKNKKTF